MRRFRWLLIIPALVIALVSGGTWAYINLIKEDAPERLAFADTTTTTAAEDTDVPAVSTGEGVDGTWTATEGSEAGYRVKEVLFGQSAEGAGRTSDVAGTLVISGTTVSAAEVIVDLTTVESDENRRDNQFRGRIMDVANYPTATFKLTEPIDFGALPADGTDITVPATGTLTLRGNTRTVTVNLQARRVGSTIEVLGTIPIVFADYDIPNPSFGQVRTEDNGEIEFLVVFSRSA
ncbi:MAG TPA: YceI family protein [Acidimicrobiia bacterium]|nr:YceI family protein [Acidimicrobiia bacterium]